jgi:hypothetical protein
MEGSGYWEKEFGTKNLLLSRGKTERQTDLLQQYKLWHGADRCKDTALRRGWVVRARIDVTHHKTINKKQNMLGKSSPLDPITL